MTVLVYEVFIFFILLFSHVLSAPVVSTKADGKADGTKAGIVTRPKIPDTANGDAKFTATTKKPDIAESGNVKLSAEIVVPKKVKSKGAAHPDVEVLEKADPKEMAEHAEGLDLQADANAKPVDKTPKIAASKSVHEENQPVLQAVPIEEPIPPQPISISFYQRIFGQFSCTCDFDFCGCCNFELCFVHVPKENNGSTHQRAASGTAKKRPISAFING